MGDFSGTIILGGDALTSAGRTDVYVAKFGPGGRHIWSQRFGDDTFDTAVDVAVDSTGNVIVTGYFHRTINFGGNVLTSSGETDLYLAKFDPSGTHIWSVKFGDVGYDYVSGVACDRLGNVVITGFYYSGDVDFGGGVLTNAGGVDMFIAKFDPNGNHLWSDNYGDTDDQSGKDVAIDGLGNIVTTGSFDGTVDFGGGVLTSNGAGDIFVAVFSPNGTHVWSGGFGDSEWQLPDAVVADASGNVFITGSFMRSVNFGGSVLTSAGNTDIYLAKFNSGGTHVWSGRFGASARDVGGDVAVARSGNVFITAGFSGDIDFGGGVLTSTGGRDVSIAEFTTDGAHIWSERFGDAEYDYAVGVVASGLFAIITGDYYGGINFGGGDLPGAGETDVFLAKFGDDLTPAQLQGFAVRCTENGIEIKWDLAETGADVEFFVLRTEAASATFRELATPTIDKQDLSFTFIDESCEPGKLYRYRVDVSDEDGRRVLFETDAAVSPATPLTLDQNYPNPFNPTTTIRFYLMETARVRLSIFNLEGKLVRTIVDEVLSDGYKEVIWDGKDARGRPVSSGLYFCQLKVGGRTLTRAMTLIK
jgi:hypothetical protein